MSAEKGKMDNLNSMDIDYRLPKGKNDLGQPYLKAVTGKDRPSFQVMSRVIR